MTQSALILRRIETALPRFAYRFASELDLQNGVALVLQREGIEFQREHVATPQDRFDFFCAGGIVIEVKIEGTFSECARQVQRYAKLPAVQGVVIATAKLWGHTVKGDSEIEGKPVRIVRLSRQAL